MTVAMEHDLEGSSWKIMPNSPSRSKVIRSKVIARTNRHNRPIALPWHQMVGSGMINSLPVKFSWRDFLLLRQPHPTWHCDIKTT